MLTHGTAFSRPQTPAAKTIHLLRLHETMTRAELMENTGLSQPTITRAVTALLDAGFITERPDLTRIQGRGRPTVPFELAETGWAHAGIVIGSSESFVGLFTTAGRLLRKQHLALSAADFSEADLGEHLAAALHRLLTGLPCPLVSIGLTTSELVERSWDTNGTATRLRHHFGVPTATSSVATAVLGSELHSLKTLNNPAAKSVMALLADEFVGIALSDAQGTRQLSPLPATHSELSETALSTEHTLGALQRRGIDATRISDVAADPAAREILDSRIQQLGAMSAELITQFQPNTFVIAGTAFTEDPAAPKLFADAVRQHADVAKRPQLRMIPGSADAVVAIGRAAALDPVLREPIEVSKSSRSKVLTCA